MGLDEVTAIARALGDPSRIRALMALRNGELCACQIVDMLQLAPSTISKHMAVLIEAGLVRARRNGRWVHYQLADESASPATRSALDWLAACVGEDERIRDDRRHILKGLRSSDPCRSG